MSGWFSVKRGITAHPIFKGNPERLAIWVWLLDNAAWQDTEHDINGKMVRIRRGSVAASERRIAAEVGVGYQVVRTFIARLKAEHMINAEVTHGRNVITLCNWAKYQSSAGADNAPSNARATHEQRTKETREQYNQKEEAKASSKKRGSRLQEDWTLPKALGEWAMAEGMSELCVRREADRFRDYWIGKAGAAGVKLDWAATWRNWVRKQLADAAAKPARSANDPVIGEIRTISGVRKKYAGVGAGWLVVHD